MGLKKSLVGRPVEEFAAASIQCLRKGMEDDQALSLVLEKELEKMEVKNPQEVPLESDPYESIKKLVDKFKIAMDNYDVDYEEEKEQLNEEILSI